MNTISVTSRDDLYINDFLYTLFINIYNINTTNMSITNTTNTRIINTKHQKF